MANEIKNLHAEVANHCGEIADLFKPGVKVTVLVRNPAVDDGDVLVTDDLIDLAIIALGKLKEKEERKLSPSDVVRNAMG
jgi:hypothetical protein